MTLAQITKFVAIIAGVSATLGVCGGAFVYVTAQATERGKMEATVDQHTKTLARIETKLDTAIERLPPTHAVGERFTPSILAPPMQTALIAAQRTAP